MFVSKYTNPVCFISNADPSDVYVRVRDLFFLTISLFVSQIWLIRWKTCHLTSMLYDVPGQKFYPVYMKHFYFSFAAFQFIDSPVCISEGNL